jgi:hypothetical protein
MPVGLRAHGALWLSAVQAVLSGLAAETRLGAAAAAVCVSMMAVNRHQQKC